MKKTVSLILAVMMILICVSCNNSDKQKSSVKTESDFSKSPQEICDMIVAGWNLGNTLDAYQGWGNIPDEPSVEEQETGWNNPVTTKEMIDFVKKSGFNAVRVPVTWELQIVENNGNYEIKKEWLERVKQVADYCIDNDMFTIVNMHHDDQTWLNISADDEEWEKIKLKYKQIWEQISNQFKSYNEKLILEGANEITATTKFDGCGDSDSDKCWWGHNEKVFVRMNELYKIFVDTVRASGENNKQRYLMIPTYGAQWYDNQIDKIEIPNNDNHMIMDIHWYSADSYNKENNRWAFEHIRDYAQQNNMGAVMGETGIVKAESDERKTAFAENVVALAKEYKIPSFLWDDGGDVAILERRNSPLSWNSNAYINAVIENSK